METSEVPNQTTKNPIEQAQESHNAVEAGENFIDLSILQWEEWIKGNVPNFSGNQQNAARLLYESSNGIKYVRDRLKSKGLTSFHTPLLVVLLKGVDANSPIIHSDGFVCIKQDFLEKYSELTMTDTYAVTRADGHVAYQGTIPNLFRLAGVEESHHEAFEQFKGKQNVINPLLESIAEYDARENEYRALGWQLRHAQEQGMESMTVEKLKERLLKARAVRQQKRESGNNF